MIINRIHKIIIPFATRFEYGRKRKIITGGTKKKNMLEILTKEQKARTNICLQFESIRVEKKNSFVKRTDLFDY